MAQGIDLDERFAGIVDRLSQKATNVEDEMVEPTDDGELW